MSAFIRRVTGSVPRAGDHFCGGGGSSTGLVAGGWRIGYAANHDQLAVNTHNVNHPDADHACVDLHLEDPGYFPYTDLGWYSPECTKWSQANGSQLPAIEEGLFEDPDSDDVATRSRLLMFDVLRFAAHHRHRYMIVENVVDIATQSKYRLAWEVWQRDLRKLGYNYRVVSLNSMHAQRLGMPAPQSRDRIYIVCWLDGEKAPDFDKVLRPKAYCPKCAEVVEAEQGWKNGRKVGRYRQAYVYLHGRCGTIVEPAWLPASAAIDWSIPGSRIGDKPLKEFFDKKTKESLGWHPLAPKTLARITAGIARYWGPFHMEAGGNQYDAADPKHPNFGDPNAYYRAWAMEEYLRVLHTAETKALAIPVEGRDGKVAYPMSNPHRTMTTRLETALLTPPHISMMGTSDYHIANSARPVDQTLPTLTATGNNDYLVAPYYGSSKSAKPVTDPIGTLTTVDRYALVTRHNSSKGDGAEMTTPALEPLRTLTTTGQQSLVTPGDIAAAEAQLYDCLFRMLEPHEVAAGMAFPADYDWHSAVDEKGRRASRRKLVKLAGNAVTPPAARDIGAAVLEAIA